MRPSVIFMPNLGIAKNVAIYSSYTLSII